MELRGVLSAVATPLDSDQGVDDQRLRSLVEATIAGGVHGLVPGGSTGEFAHLTGAERRQVAEVVLHQAAGRVPVAPNVGAMTDAEAVGLARHAAEHGSSAVMAVAPYYDHLSVAETKEYFRSIADAVDVPVIVYNLPLATGVKLTPEDLVDIAEAAPNIKYVKDTTGDYHQVARLVHEYSEVLGTFIGWDTMLLAAFVEGVAGSIIGATNFVAPQLVAVWDAVQQGELAVARSRWEEVFPVLSFLLDGGYVAGIKGAFDVLGAPIGPPRSPVSSLGPERRSELEGILKPFNPGV